jgi:hypothetical protein
MVLPVNFDEARCAPGLETLRQYRVDYDEKLRSFKKTPKEDWTSDAADAFRYVAMAWKEMVKVPEPGTMNADHHTIGEYFSRYPVQCSVTRLSGSKARTYPMPTLARAHAAYSSPPLGRVTASATSSHVRGDVRGNLDWRLGVSGGGDTLPASGVIGAPSRH